MAPDNPTIGPVDVDDYTANWIKLARRRREMEALLPAAERARRERIRELNRRRRRERRNAERDTES